MATKKNTDVDAAPPDEVGLFQHHFSFTYELDKHPLMMAMSAVAVFIIIIYIYSHLKNNASQTTLPQSGQNNTTTGTTVATPQVYLQYPVTQPVPTTTSTPATIRASQANTGGPFANYDKTHSGVPFYSSIGVQSGTIPYGASVTITGSAVAGPATGPNSVSTYFPITWNNTNGYVSTEDIS